MALDKKWFKKLDHELGFLSRPWRGAASDEFVDCYSLACEVFNLEKHASNDESGLKAFAYLWRRFGEPSGNGDRDKDLCEYIFSTPMKDVAIWITPRGSGLAYGVGYYVGSDTMEKLNAAQMEWWKKCWDLANEEGKEFGHAMEAYFDKEFWAKATEKLGSCRLPRDWREGSKIRKKVNEAILATLKELLRPVYIRDVAINILGRL